MTGMGFKRNRRIRQAVLLREIDRLNQVIERLNGVQRNLVTVVRSLAIHRSNGRSFTINPRTVERSDGYDVAAKDVDGGIRIEVTRRDHHG